MRSRFSNCGTPALWLGIPISAALCAPGSVFSDGAPGCSAPAARFASLEGDVQVRDASLDWRRAELLSRLCNGDSVRVGSRSRAAMVLANEAVMRLDQNTTMRLTSLAAAPEQRGVVEMLRGAVQSFIRKPRTLTVNTPYLNGSIEGTEFQVRVDDDRASLQVMEGQVRVANPQGEVLATPGTIAVAAAGAAPLVSAVVRPLDAVQWTLYFPPVYSADSAPPLLAEALRRYRAGDADGAFAALDVVLEAQRDADWHSARTTLLLGAGRADEAAGQLDAALAIDARHGPTLALKALLRVLRNDNAAALIQAREAVAADDSAPTRIALSYALQANFRLDEAREVLRAAVAAHPRDALLQARLGELELMLGDSTAAAASAAKAVALEPELARAQAVEGFVALARYDAATAQQDFERAIALSPADPLSHLGLGLALVTSGATAAGRGELEIAVALDPNQALLRAYLGKAYFDERRGPLDAQQFHIAQQLDPLDPTAFLYEALRKQADNRPVEAIADLRQSIALNDNRAIYRSRLLLDRDRATRGASLANAYRDVGYLETGLRTADGSLSDDPGDASAHRFLSDVYGGLRRREIAKVSELMQAQLLQDFQLAPLSPSAGEANLNLATGAGPAGYNEFSSLFQRDRLQGTATLIGGNRDSLGGEVALSGVVGPLSFGLGALNWQSDGFRPNNDLRQAVYTAFAQAAINTRLNVQAEYRHRDSGEGDLAFNFNPDDYIAQHRVGRNIDSARLGLRYALTPSDRLLVSLIRSWREESLDELRDLPPVAGATTFTNHQLAKETANQAEALYLGDFAFGKLQAGAALTRGRRSDDQQVSVDDSELGNLLSIDALTPSPSQDRRVYAYWNSRPLPDWLLTVGGSVQRFEQGDFGETDFNPKLGLQWQASPAVRLRAAALQTIKPTLVSNRTLEPTVVAGFNQLYDDLNGTRSRLYGLGADWQLTARLTAGLEASRRDLDEPQFDFDGLPITEDRRETLARWYWNWSASDRIAIRGGYSYDRYTAASGIATQADNLPERVSTHSAQFGFNYFDPVGWFVGTTVNGVQQSLRRDPFATQAVGEDRFALVDLDAGYRLPRRLGVIRVSVRNLFDTGFRYQDDSYREFRDEPSVGPYFPIRTVTARLVLDF